MLGAVDSEERIRLLDCLSLLNYHLFGKSCLYTLGWRK